MQRQQRGRHGVATAQAGNGNIRTRYEPFNPVFCEKFYWLLLLLIRYGRAGQYVRMRTRRSGSISSWHFGLGRRMLVTIPLASAGGGWRWHRSVTASFAHSELHSGSSRRHHPRYIHSVSASRPSRRSSHPASPSLDIISAFHYHCRTFHIDTQSATQWPNRWRESRFRPQKSTSHRRQTNSRNV